MRNAIKTASYALMSIAFAMAYSVSATATPFPEYTGQFTECPQAAERALVQAAAESSEVVIVQNGAATDSDPPAALDSGQVSAFDSSQTNIAVTAVDNQVGWQVPKLTKVVSG